MTPPSPSLQVCISVRRTAIEVAIVAERVKAMQAEWKWINSFQQLADGLTKPSAKDKFAEFSTEAIIKCVLTQTSRQQRK